MTITYRKYGSNNGMKWYVEVVERNKTTHIYFPTEEAAKEYVNA